MRQNPEASTVMLLNILLRAYSPDMVSIIKDLRVVWDVKSLFCGLGDKFDKSYNRTFSQRVGKNMSKIEITSKLNTACRT